jgi:transposase
MLPNLTVKSEFTAVLTGWLRWKRRFGVDLAFLPVEVVPEPAAPVVEPAFLDSKIEIQLSSGHRLSVSGAFDPDAVARLLRGLSS